MLVPTMDRVILVVLDGLRPDAIDCLPLATLRGLRVRSAHAMQATTVSPSVTAAAMASLLTGVAPVAHGVRCDRFHIPRRREPLEPLAAVLAHRGIPTTAFVRQLPRLYRPLAARVAAHVGITDARFGGQCARDLVLAARAILCSPAPGLVVLHWPDADRAGHESGWMSARYAGAARDLDDALADVLAMIRLDRHPTTMLAVVADHGGGGADPREHDSAHFLDTTIPVLFAGERVRSGPIAGPVSLLDVSPTIVAALGCVPPVRWPGRVLQEALTSAVVAA